MKLDLRPLLRQPGASQPFEFQMDLSGLEWNGERPVPEPVRVEGRVRNMAGALTLYARMETQLSLVCDRCAKPFTREKTVEYETLLSESPEDGDGGDVVLLDRDGQLELDELLRESFLLELDTKNLCREDCKGLCPGCGADLNTEPCRCKRTVDPRLAKLADLLDRE